MDKYLEAELRLAAALGWKIKLVGDVATGWIDQDGKYKSDLPRWCRDWSACGPLMVEHSAFPVELRNKGEVTGYAFQHPFPINTIISVKDHPDRKTAIMFAVVQAVIAKLEAENG